jgi:hypothetical protein
MSNTLTSLTESAIITGQKEVREYTFSDGSKVTMTDNHPILTDKGWVPASELTLDHKVKKLEWQKNTKLEQSKLTDINGLVTNMGTTGVVKQPWKNGTYIDTYGVSNTERFQKACTYTTKMKTSTITQLKTCNVSADQSIVNCTDSKETCQNRKNTLTRLESWWTTASIGVKKVKNFTEKISKRIEKRLIRRMKKSADGAVRRLNVSLKKDQGIAIESANFNGYKPTEKKSTHVKNAERRLSGIKKRLHAQKNARKCTNESNDLNMSMSVSSVEANLKLTERSVSSAQINVGKLMADLNLSPENVKSVEQYFSRRQADLGSAIPNAQNVTLESVVSKGVQTVYNMEVPDGHNFLVANGIVVHNCDLLNQLSEMDIFKPSEQTNASEKIDGYLDNDGELWWPEEKEEDYGGSTVF